MFTIKKGHQPFPCPLYLFSALFLLVAEIFVCFPLPWRDFLGFPTTYPPPFICAIFNYSKNLQCGLMHCHIKLTVLNLVGQITRVFSCPTRIRGSHQISYPASIASRQKLTSSPHMS